MGPSRGGFGLIKGILRYSEESEVLACSYGIWPLLVTVVYCALQRARRKNFEYFYH